jgi:hypothetical protein
MTNAPTAHEILSECDFCPVLVLGHLEIFASASERHRSGYS